MGKSGHRSLEAINTEYSQACGHAGDSLHKFNIMKNELNKWENRMRELDLEAGAARKSAKEDGKSEQLKEVQAIDAEVSDQAIIGDART